jgi:hypothetical protein
MKRLRRRKGWRDMRAYLSAYHRVRRSSRRFISPNAMETRAKQLSRFCRIQASDIYRRPYGKTFITQALEEALIYTNLKSKRGSVTENEQKIKTYRHLWERRNRQVHHYIQHQRGAIRNGV